MLCTERKWYQFDNTKTGQITQYTGHYHRNGLIASTLTSLEVYILYLIMSVIVSVFSFLVQARQLFTLAVLTFQWQPHSDDSILMKTITLQSASCHHWFSLVDPIQFALVAAKSLEHFSLWTHFHRLCILIALFNQLKRSSRKKYTALCNFLHTVFKFKFNETTLFELSVSQRQHILGTVLFFNEETKG